MVNKIVSIPGYVHLYRSLLRFYHMPENEIKEICFGYYHPEIFVVQSGPALFSTWLDNMNYRPYRTEVQLHKALVCLKHSVDREFMTVEQREALQKLRCIISNIEYRFYKAFGIEIDDDRTVYNECAFSLVPDEDEPSVCLMHDWVYLPTA